MGVAAGMADNSDIQLCAVGVSVRHLSLFIMPTIAANIMILVVLLSVRGNVARLVDALRH